MSKEIGDGNKLARCAKSRQWYTNRIKRKILYLSVIIISYTSISCEKEKGYVYPENANISESHADITMKGRVKGNGIYKRYLFNTLKEKEMLGPSYINTGAGFSLSNEILSGALYTPDLQNHIAFHIDLSIDSLETRVRTSYWLEFPEDNKVSVLIATSFMEQYGNRIDTYRINDFKHDEEAQIVKFKLFINEETEEDTGYSIKGEVSIKYKETL